MVGALFFLRARFGGGFYLCVFRYFFSAILRMDFEEMRGAPRTAIGQISPLHYIIIVSDGRTDESEGFSLLQLAEEMQNRGAVTAYNLDGGGSSTLYFNGEIINNPTNGNNTEEREVSEIVYFGYE